MNGIPEPPPQMNDAAKQIWRAFAPQYAVEIQDIPLFEQFCNAYASYRELMLKVNEVGPLVTIKGDVVTNPNLARADREAANFKHAIALMQRLKHGRRNDAQEEDDTNSESDAIEALRSQIIAHITAAGQDADGLAVDRQSDRDCPEEQAAPARRVRKKKDPGNRPAKEEKP